MQLTPLGACGRTGDHPSRAELTDQAFWKIKDKT